MTEISKFQRTYYSQAVILLVLMHLAGFLGLQFGATRSWFESLVPFNLVVCGLLIVFFQQQLNAQFIQAMGFIFLGGFVIELLGVKTKVIFGDYYYEGTLGWKLFEVPVIIGLNWFVLVCTTGLIGHKLSRNILTKVLVGALLMVGVDVLIEPVAIRHNFWAWNHAEVPLQNYLAWFVVSIGMLFIYHLSDFAKENKIAIPLFFAQTFFFLAHNLTYL